MMQDSPNLLRVTLQLVRDAVVTTDSEARVQMLNPAAEAMCGLTTEEAAGKHIDDVFRVFVDVSGGAGAGVPLSTIARESIRKGIETGAASKGAELVVLQSGDGRRASVEVSALPYSPAEGARAGCVLVLHDMRRMMELAERISHAAQHDALTGLPNRILLVDRLEQATKFADRKKEQLAVIFIGLDDIGRVRSEAGTAVSDELLREAAFRIGAVMRESDTVCRLGADEFVVVAPGVHLLSDVEAVAVKLIDEIARPHLAGDRVVQTACSVGISVYPQDANDSATLMRLADGAMRQARTEARRRYRFAGVAVTPQEKIR